MPPAYSMTNILLFNLILGTSCLYALVRGGMPERVAAAIYIVAATATTLLPYRLGHSFAGVETMYLLVDCGVLAAIGVLALRADRFWPLWSASIQAVAVTVHGAKAFDPSILAYVYFVATSKLAYPMLLMLAVGTFRHRQRLSQFGSDPSWSFGPEACDERGAPGQARRE